MPEPFAYTRIFSAWHEQAFPAAPALKSTLLCDSELYPRFVAQYRTLQALSRQGRRAIERRWKRSISAIALLLALNQTAALAATIGVNDSCSLAQAITAANLDIPVGGCPAGLGVDAIVLPVNSKIVLNEVDNTVEGANGLPVVSSNITIFGNGSTIKRSAAPDTPAFRILLVNYSGRLTLTDATISGGKAAPQEESLGGGVSNSGGTVFLINSTISGNTAAFGGGAGNANDPSQTAAKLYLYNSTVSGNSATQDAGGVANVYGTIFAQNTTISGNSAARLAGGVQNARGTMTVGNVTIARNSAAGGIGGVLNFGTLFLRQSLISGNRAPGPGKEIFNNIVPPYFGTIVGNDFNLFGRNSSGTALYGFAPVGSDQLLAVPLSEILDTKLDFNGGSTQSHALVSGSPAIDAIPSANCFSSYDQRNGLRPEDGDGNGTFMCDVGAIEHVSDPPVCDFEVISSGCTVNGIAGQSCGGTSGDDTIVGTSGNDVIVGLAGNDDIAGGEGDDRICGGAGNDTLTGESGNDRLFGESGSDRLRGRDDNDALFGGRGIDTCGAGPGVDFTKDCETIVAFLNRRPRCLAPRHAEHNRLDYNRSVPRMSYSGTPG